MRVTALLSPGVLSNGLKIRTEIAKAISSVEVTAARSAGNVTSGAGQLAAFLTHAAAQLVGLYETTLPTVSSRIVAVGAGTIIRVTFSEAMDQTVIPAVASWTIAGANAGGRTIVTAAWASSTVLLLTLSSAIVAGNVITLAYTQPSVNATRDLAANKVASYAAAAVTNNLV